MAQGTTRAGAALLLGLVLPFLAGPALAASDAELQRRIEKRLAKAGLQKRADIRVEVESGVARLSGITLRWPDLREADRLARKETPTVVNLLRVVPEEPRPDNDIHADAEAAIQHWARYGPFDAVGVEVDGGVVHLNGWVESPFKKTQIEEQLTGVDGIRDVLNDLRVQGFSPGDVELRRDIHDRIYADPLFERWAGMPDPPVRVYVDKGRVTLAGTVQSTLEKTMVGLIAGRSLAFAVNNQVQVKASEEPAEDRKKDPSET